LNETQSRDDWPTRILRTATPEEHGIDPQRLARLHEHVQGIAVLHSLLIVRSGSIVFEEYYHGWSKFHYQNVNSVTKSVVSALVGIALRDGFLRDLDQALLSFFPEYTPPTIDPRKQAITLRHLLSMSSGFDEMPADEIETFLDRSNSIEKLLNRPMRHEPGRAFAYDDLCSHLVSLILNRVTGIPLATFARTRLFEPLGIWRDEQGNPSPWKLGRHTADAPHPVGLWDEREDELWSVDNLGNNIGGFGLQLTTREMAKFGYLYLKQGQWEDAVILPRTFVQDSWQQHSVTGKGEGYGYFWFLPRWHGHSACCAVGYGGQMIAVIPDLDVVAVITCRPEPGTSPSRSMMHDIVVPALEIGR
jgi:CubicO group peptidase (beta-lactamase class C family)